MEDQQHDIVLKPIGAVRSPLKERERRDAKEVIAEIVIDPAFAEGLDNIEDFSHLIILFYFHKTRRPAPLKVRPKYRTEPAPVGVFASRSPDRPNAIGKTVVKLLERRNNILKVQGLDAINGTPVLDIKPYIPEIDTAPGAKVPGWMRDRG
jgi:tRNA-Thr(GGU) m(6)t(6)A37 methyltransferase TsaA